jgi:hypothetical protein
MLLKTRGMCYKILEAIDLSGVEIWCKVPEFFYKVETYDTGG